MNILKTKNTNKLTVFLLILCMAIGLSGCSLKENLNGLINKSIQSEKRETVRITFPEGSNVFQIAQKLEENGVCSAEDFMNQANDVTFLKSYSFLENVDLEGRTFAAEGYLYPDTYDFYVDEGAESAIKRFLNNTQSKYGGEITEQCGKLGYTLDEIINLASLIQEEAGVPSEMPMISSVLHNRLDSSDFPKLQCDASSFYLRDFIKPLVDEAEYERLKNAYSTYICEGLSAGPITNPGIDAVNAALNPEETDYYFFCSDNDGNYYYAETFDEHTENCVQAGIMS